MGDALSCLDDREEEKQRYNEKPPTPAAGQPPASAAGAPATTTTATDARPTPQPASTAPAPEQRGATRRDGSVTRSNYRARSNSRARNEGVDAEATAEAQQAADAASKRDEISKDKMDRARTLLRASLKAENVPMIDEAIRKAGKVLPTDELEQAQAQKRRISRMQKEKAAETAATRVPASTPNLRNSGTAAAPTSKVPKTSATLTAPPAPDLPPVDEAAQAAAIEKLTLLVDDRRIPELADAIAEAEAAGVGKKEQSLRRAKEMKEADTKRKEMARMRRAKERGEAN